MDAAPVFRTDRRRKSSHLARKRSHSDDEAVEQSTVVRKLKQQKARGSGIQVASTKPVEVTESNHVPESPGETSELTTNAYQNRFIGSVGRKASHDKRLSNFVELEISKHRQQKTHDQRQSSTNAHEEQPESIVAAIKQQRPETNHRITEVELTSTDTHENTSAERGSRRMRKSRRTRDGQSFRTHQRRRQNSVDAARDSLVEQVLHENALDVYGSSESDDGSDENKEGDVDERVAERFQQQFMEAQTERMQHQQGLKAKSSAVTNSGGSGPKLGGGRSARAKMNALGQGKQ